MPAVGFDKALSNGQAQAGAGLVVAGFFARPEAFEDEGEIGIVRSSATQPGWQLAGLN